MNLGQLYLLALVVGIVAGVYLPLNSRLGQQLGSPLLATAIFFSVGAITAVLAWLLLARGAGLERLSHVQPPLLLLGMVSFGIIFCATWFIPKLGPGAYFICLIAGQVLAGLALSHFGWLAPERLPLTPLKLIGALLLVGGVLLIRHVEGQQRAQLSPTATAAQHHANNAVAGSLGSATRGQ